MAWPTPPNPGDLIASSLIESIILALSNWGGDVSGGGHNLQNVAKLGIGTSTVVALEVVTGSSGDGAWFKQNAGSTGYMFCVYQDTTGNARIGSFDTVAGWRPVNLVGLDGEAVRVMNSAQDGALFLGYHSASNSARLGSFNVSWRPLVINEGGSAVWIGKTSGGASAKFGVANNPVFASNAAAISGGLTAGDFYRTSTGQVMVVF